jgi:PKD repeat protein
MTIARTILRRLLPAVVLGSLAIAAISATPALAVYGELAHFGEPGTGKGQFNLTESFGTTEGLGVDATTNTVYAVDGPTAKQFRIQKFELVSGKWTSVASVKFKPVVENESKEKAEIDKVEGVAVDHARNRVYVLVGVARLEEQTVDPEEPVAAQLYSFDASTLEAATGTTNGLLVGADGAGSFQAFSETGGVPILNPSGIAVDPTTGDVIVQGYEDPTGTTEEPEQRVTLQRISSTGVLGARWKDEGNFFTADDSVLPAEVTSPVVSAAGKVYVSGGTLPAALGEAEEIDEIPSSFAAGTTPTPLVQFISEGLITFPGVPAPNSGAGITVGPEGDFYAFAQVTLASTPPEREPAVLAFGSTGSELGWVGGQNQPEEGGHVPCAISFRGHPLVAAGEAGDVFVFDSSPKAPDIVEFGPGGSGCPTASATAPVATVSKATQTHVKAGATVNLASTITQADALTVEWELINRTAHTTEKVLGPPNEFQLAEINHTFASEGEYTIKVTIGTDDLASAPLVEESALTVEGSLPTPQFAASPQPANVGEAVKFNPEASAGNGSRISSYRWIFGDGSETTTTTPTTVEHVYSAAGEYHVKLIVTNAKGPSETEATVIVNGPAGGGGGTTTTGGGGTTTTTTTGTTTTPTQVVQSYRATIAGTSLTVSSNGAVTIKVACQGQSSCAGTLTLRTQSAVAAKRKTILTLGSASFAASGGTVKSVTVHLSAKGRALLARMHTLKVAATIVARDSSGTSHTTAAVVSLRAAKAHRKG